MDGSTVNESKRDGKSAGKWCQSGSRVEQARVRSVCRGRLGRAVIFSTYLYSTVLDAMFTNLYGVMYFSLAPASSPVCTALNSTSSASRKHSHTVKRYPKTAIALWDRRW